MTSLRPQPRPDNLKPVEVYTPSPESQALALFYGRLEQDLQTRGLLRVDGGAVDTPYDAEDLSEAFQALAFYDEYGDASASGTGRLARWTGPVVMQAVFGPSVSAEQRIKDKALLSAYATRLSRLTGHRITTGARGNFTVLFAGLDDADFVRARVQRLLPNMSEADLALFATPPRQFYCLVTAGGPAADPLRYSRGVALIRAEQPPLMREACIHEELAQGLGLRNDSQRARPSIFNDDDEFARLTSHDEKLLAMLYDARLNPGMSIEEALPLIPTLAAEQMGLTPDPDAGASPASPAF
ncbi:DUF2927 domain-containing protein [Tritonibacter multivorans]|nr:DUF2927 domain-containing protein [Tritonibacter multivorans]MDA7420758.1 DUF2927 domain-containing protein [Tritonibacter multivorans]